MEGIAALSLAASIIQVVDYTTRLVRNSKQISQSTSGTTEENQSLNTVVKHIQQLAVRLKPPSSGEQLNDDETSLAGLAEECRKISGEVLARLKRIMPKDPKSKTQITWSSLKGLWSEKEIRKLEERLSKCQNAMTSQEVHIVRYGVDTANATLNSLKLEMDELRRGVDIKSLSTTAEEQLSKVFAVLQAATADVKVKHIQKGLHFPEMGWRFDTVEPAHEKTFRWLIEDGHENYHPERSRWLAESIFEKQDREKRTSERSHRRDLFLQWLQEGDNVFHIVGKLGSGKSTLMKLLASHKVTLQRLLKWAGSKKLVFASFFFWRPGTPLQKNLIGLKRSLLHDIITECPEIAEELFPHQWQQMLGAERSHIDDIKFQEKDIETAFARLIQNQIIYDSRRFCFFIDGLDEFADAHRLRQDYLFVAQELKKWAELSHGALKLCVSSRELVAFEETFSSDKRIRLQDLTYEDITRYVEDEIRCCTNEDVRHIIAQTVVERSDGIFLWVSLVVRRLRDCMAVDRSLLDWKAELQSMPKEIKLLLQHMLDSIPEAHQEVPYQVFAMMDALQIYTHESLSLLSFSFLDDYRMGRLNAESSDFGFERLDEHLLRERESAALKKLKRYCQGLVEAAPKRRKNRALVYPHRSIPEFLAGYKVSDDLRAQLRQFDVEDAISQLYLAEIKAQQNLRPHQLSLNLSGSLPRLHAVFGSRARRNMDTRPYHYLESLDAAIVQRLEPNKSIQVTMLLDCHYFAAEQVDSVLIHESAYWGEPAYFQWKLDQGLRIHESIAQTMAALNTLFWGFKTGVSGRNHIQDTLALMQQLVTMRASFTNHNSHTTLDRARDGRHLTIAFFNLMRTPARDPGDYASPKTMIQGFGLLLDHMLQVTGFDPRIGGSTEESEDGHIERWKMPFARAPASFHEPNGYDISRHMLLPNTSLTLEAKRHMTLTDVVEFWELENKEEKIAQIEQRTNIMNAAKDFANTFWRFEVADEKAMMMTLHMEAAGSSHDQPNTLNNQDTQDEDKVKENEDVQQEDEEANLRELLMNNAIDWMKRVTHSHRNNEDVCMRDQAVMDMLIWRRRKLLEAAGKYAKDHSWSLTDEEELLSAIDVKIVYAVRGSVETHRFEWDVQTRDEMIDMFIRWDQEMFARDPTMVMPVHTAPRQAPVANKVTNTLKRETEQTISLETVSNISSTSAPASGPTIVEEPPNKENTTQVREVPTSPHLPLRRTKSWQNYLALVTIGIILAIVGPHVWSRL